MLFQLAFCLNIHDFSLHLCDCVVCYIQKKVVGTCKIVCCILYIHMHTKIYIKYKIIPINNIIQNNLQSNL